MADASQSAVPVAEVEVTAVAVELPSLATRIEWFDDWEEKTRDSRNEARRDRQYYDNKQWTDEEIQRLKERHQPILVKNRIARKVNFILGEEIKKRVDPAARPRTPTHEDSARAATDALRYVEEEQKFDKVRSAVLKNVLIEGYGGAIKEIDDSDGEYRHKLKHIEWDRLFYDPHSRSPDFDDAKYLGIVVWMDLDDAVLAYPDAAGALRAAMAKDVGAASETTDDAPRTWTDRRRKRVKFCEMYFRVGQDWFRSVFTESADVEPPQRTIYLDEKRRHSVCPLLLLSCYVDSEGMRYGVVRQLISPQDEINKRSSKALHLLNVRQVIAEEGAVPAPETFRDEIAKPDGYAIVNPGALTENRLQVTTTSDLAQGQIALLQEAKQDIDTIGPSSANMPDVPESSSGRAFLARMQAASQELGPVFDQLRAWDRRVFELDWLCIRLFWTAEKWLRVTDDQELTGYRFVALNRQMTRGQRLQEMLQKKAPPESALAAAAGEFAPIIFSQAQQALQAMAAQAQAAGQQMPQDPSLLLAAVLRHPLMQQPVTVNQVDQMLVDIVIDEAPETAILAQEEFATLSELFPMIAQSRPDMAPTMAKLIVKASSLPNKRELLKDLEKGPDEQAMQQQAQAQQIQQAIAKSQVAVNETKAQLQQAQTAKTAAEAQVAVPKTAAEIQGQQAQAMERAARAGHMSAAPMPMQAGQGEQQ